ncbi:MAG: preprotein translocase subunit SecA, partial [Spirochaetes bacterium]|nr:preprotein translocase subunit SecA [Spirochaetota bacterium]
REVSKRHTGLRPYDVQMIGGILLHNGDIAEMKTGEGKTLVATLPSYLNALSGDGVHVVTVNDYLSRRDAVWMGQIHYALGLSVSCINQQASYSYDPIYQNQKLEDENKEEISLDKIRDEKGSFHVVHEFLRPCSKKEAYSADIVYGTNNEFGFDYLRDNIVYEKDKLVQRKYNFAIVDEIDSILIDEARTPLIISVPSAGSTEMYTTFSKIAEKLSVEKHFTVDEKMKAISLTEDGIELAEKLLGVKDIYTEKGIKYVHHLETAVRAKALFVRDKDYVVKDNNVIIIDEFTGRMMEGRRWSEGLHQAVEAKESVKIQEESRTFASITFQNYFRMYKKLSGMTGTALSSAEEFDKVYGLETLEIPSNKTVSRIDQGDIVFQTEKGKFSVIVKKIKELNKKQQPVLVGTVSIDKNEHLAALLKKEGVPHRLLNAKKHEEEGEIIAQAGRLGRVTIATNMAGRGVDIVLGGAPKDEDEAEKVKKLGGLFVIGTERHEARRIDNQLRGRSGRQGDAGETQFFISLEDDLMRIFGSDRMKNMMGRFGIPEDEPIKNKMINNAIESAQTKIEGFNFDARKHLLEYDNVLNHQRNIIYKRRREILMSDDSSVMGLLKKIFINENLGVDGLEKKREELGEESFYRSERVLMLQAIDMLWVEHLEMMDYLRSSVRLRAYGQRDPLIEYKNEAIGLFRQLEGSINRAITTMALRIGSSDQGLSSQSNNQQVQEIHNQAKTIGNKNVAINMGAGVNKIKKVGRNDPCPCNSGKKYKKCCINK